MPRATKSTDQNVAAEQFEETVQPAEATEAAATYQTESAEQGAAVLSNAQIDREAKSMKAILDARPKVRVKIVDRDAAEAGTTPPPHPVGINGYVYRIPWNNPVEVPDRVADILERQGLI